MGIKRAIGKIGLKVGGWNDVYDVPADLGNAVCIVAPHTAVADFFVGICYFWAHDFKYKVMMKQEFFKPIIGWILKKMGGIPVNRGHRNNLVEQMIDLFSQSQNIKLFICPEGTRKKVNHWKRGFHLIAQGAHVPIMIGFLDYEKKRCGVEKVLYPTDNYEKDLAEIWDYYRSIKVMGKHPEQFNLYDDYKQ